MCLSGAGRSCVVSNVKCVRFFFEGLRRGSSVTCKRGDGTLGIGGARRCDFLLLVSVVRGDRSFLRMPSAGCPSDPNDIASVTSKSVKSMVSEGA